MRNGSTFTFGPQQYILQMERQTKNANITTDEIGEFAGQADLLSRIVTNELGLESFTRIGYRSWFNFTCQSLEEAERWILSTGAFRPNEGLISQFGGTLVTGAASFVVAAADRRYRITFNSVERPMQLDLGDAIMAVPSRQLSSDQRRVLTHQQKRVIEEAEAAGTIDVDAYQEDPLSPDPKDFIETTSTGLLTKLREALSDTTK